MRKHSSLWLLLVGLILLLSGCATPMGQQYGTAGALGGAIVGGATGGARGALIGGATGAILGGITGDSIQLQGGQPYYQQPGGGYYGGGYYRQPECWTEDRPVRDPYGYVVRDSWGRPMYRRQRVCR